METKCSAGGAPGTFKIFTRKVPPRNHLSSTQNLNLLRHEAFDYLTGTANITRRAASNTVQVPDLSWPPIVKRDNLEDIIRNAEVLVTPQRSIQFANMVLLMPILFGRPTDYQEEQIPQIGASWVPSFRQGPVIHLEPQEDLFQEGCGHSLRVTGTELKS